MAQLLKSMALRQIRLQKKIGECSEDGLVCLRGTLQSNIHKGAQGVVTVSQRDMIILEGEKCVGLY